MDCLEVEKEEERPYASSSDSRSKLELSKDQYLKTKNIDPSKTFNILFINKNKS